MLRLPRRMNSLFLARASSEIAVGLHAAPPAGVAHQVDIRRPESEALVDAPLAAPDELIVLGAGLVGDRRGHAEEEFGIPRRGEADRHGEHGGAAGAGHAVQAFVPPVVGGDAEPLDGRRRVRAGSGPQSRMPAMSRAQETALWPDANRNPLGLPVALEVFRIEGLHQRRVDRRRRLVRAASAACRHDRAAVEGLQPEGRHELPPLMLLFGRRDRRRWFALYSAYSGYVALFCLTGFRGWGRVKAHGTYRPDCWRCRQPHERTRWRSLAARPRSLGANVFGISRFSGGNPSLTVGARFRSCRFSVSYRAATVRERSAGEDFPKTFTHPARMPPAPHSPPAATLEVLAYAS